MAEEFRSDDFPLDSIATPEYHTVRHALTGSRQGVQRTIHRLHNLGYTQAGDWSPPQPTGKPNEVISLLIQVLRLE